jgi:ComF family protein
VRSYSLLCGASSAERLCRACAGELPRASAACPRCALPLGERQACGRCLRHPPAFDAASAALLYRFPVDRLVLRFKSCGDFAAGRWLAGELARVTARLDAPDLLVAPPLARARLRQRGFNQALQLARAIGGERAIEVDGGAIVKPRETPLQASLDRRARLANLRGAFEVRAAVAGKHVAIVDDVMTTGATAEALACALKDAGACRVSVWVAARTPDPRR